MGLDMYLHAERSFYNSDGERAELALLADKLLPPDAGNLGIVEISREVAYWRKANAIHGWFVNTLADGCDECQRITVYRKNLEELRSLCQELLAGGRTGLIERMTERGIAPTGGFFFGSTDNAEWQEADLKLTVAQLDRILNDENSTDCDFYYQASW